MQPIPINWWALIVATLAKFFFGWIWFGPVFGKAWFAMSGMTKEEAKAKMPLWTVIDLVTTFILAFVLVHAIRYAGAANWLQGAAVGFLNWLGFIGTITLAHTAWDKRPFKFWLLNNAYYATALAIMGAILAVWT